MSWLDLPRVPEPEVMDDSDEVEAYASAATQAYLDKIDDTFVGHAVRLVAARATGRALDIGTGPGQIVLKLARRLPSWQFIGVDRSANMIRQARAASGLGRTQPASVGVPLPSTTLGTSAAPSRGPAAQLGGRSFSSDIGNEQSGAELVPSPPGRIEGAPEARVEFFVADGNRLAFPDTSFDLVMCNSVLHHLAQPQRLLAEMARLVKPDGAILVRDLRRPSRLAYPLHVRWYGRHYSGLMYQLYCASVRSAYTVRELEEMLCSSPLSGARPAQSRGARVFRHERTHLGLERPVKQ